MNFFTRNVARMRTNIEEIAHSCIICSCACQETFSTKHEYDNTITRKPEKLSVKCICTQVCYDSDGDVQNFLHCIALFFFVCVCSVREKLCAESFEHFHSRRDACVEMQ